MPPAQWAVVEFAAINNVLGGIYVTVESIVNGLHIMFTLKMAQAECRGSANVMVQ